MKAFSSPQKRKPNSIESDDGNEFVNKTFSYLLHKNFFKRFSRYTSKWADFAERFNQTIGDAL